MEASGALDSGDNLYIYLVNETTIDANSDSTPVSIGNCIDLRSTAYVLDSGEWVRLPGAGSDQVASNNWHTKGTWAVQLTQSRIAAATSATAIKDRYLWFRIDLLTASQPTSGRTFKNIDKLKGFAFKGFQDVTEQWRFSDMSVVIWSTPQAELNWKDVKSVGYEKTYDDFLTPTTTNQLIPFAHTPSNIAISFRDVTQTGMTVLASAPFSGVVRYLCSVQG